MTYDLCFSAKGSFNTKPPKKNPLVLKLLVYIFALICVVYIFSVPLGQFGERPAVHLSNPQVIERPCASTNIEPSEKSYVHFPKPKTFSRDECACNPLQNFAILSTQRSGSVWFETLLNSNINISSNGEIFSVKTRRGNISTIIETLDNIYNLDWPTSSAKNECTAAVGLKWMLNQSLMQHHEEIVKYFKDKGVSIIFLFRRNLLRRMVSVLAKSYDQNARPLNGTHKSHVQSSREVCKHPKQKKRDAGGLIVLLVRLRFAKYKSTVDTKLLIPNLKQAEDLVIKSLEYFKNTLNAIIYYEDIIKNRTKLKDVQDFLKVPQWGLNNRQVKIHKGSLSSQIEN